MSSLYGLILPIMRNMISKYFIPFNMPFHFVWALWCTETFQSDILPLTYFVFAAFAFGVMSQNIIASMNFGALLPLFSYRSFVVSGLTFRI